MSQLLNIPYKIYYHYKILGFQGGSLLFKRYIRQFEYFDILLSKYLHPVRLRNNTTDITVFYQVFLAKSYELNYRIEPKFIIDCGANIGLATVFFKNKFPNAKVIAIEPEDSIFKLLQENTQKYNDVHCVKSGIWDKSANLIIKESNDGNWVFTVEEVDYENESTIAAISITEIMKKYKIDTIDILRIDIEGSEKEVFENNFEYWLSKTKVLIIELHDGLKAGASKSFFIAITKYNFVMSRKGENLIFHFNNH
jgi:FkbM family methyltransferase